MKSLTILIAGVIVLSLAGMVIAQSIPAQVAERISEKPIPHIPGKALSVIGDRAPPFADAVPNQPPVLLFPGNQTINESQMLVIQLNASDPDNDTLNYSYTSTISPNSTNISLNSTTGLFIWTPNYADAGVYFVSFEVSDGQLSDFEGIMITVLESCPADFDGNGTVNVTDLLALLAGWGTAGTGDVNGDGTVNVTDLLKLLAAWGSC